MGQQPGQQAGKAQQANNAAQRKQAKQAQISRFHRVQHAAIQPQQQQNEAAGNARQDHRADRQRPAEEKDQRRHRVGAQPGGQGDQRRQRGADHEGHALRHPALLQRLEHHHDAGQDQTAKERPYRHRMVLQQPADHPGQ